MDNLCHTLAGAALGEAGLKRRTGLGMATLLIGANLPDVDVLAIPFGHGIDFRRGWTHGVLALAVLPFLLTGLLLLWDRAARRHAGREPVRPAQLLLLAAVSILSHPLLDFLNSYGVRLLMPFSGRWFYGDALFIVDAWMWLALGAGYLLARRRRAPRPARLALGVAAAYVGLNLAGSALGRGVVARGLERHGVRADVGPYLMVGPVPANPFRREVVLAAQGRYFFGSLDLLPAPRFELDGESLPIGADDPAVAAAGMVPEAQRFLVWARFPFFLVDRTGGDTRVRFDDARYSRGDTPSFAAVEVRLPGGRVANR